MRSKALVVAALVILTVAAGAGIYGQVRMAADTTIATDRTNRPPQTQIIQDGIMPLSPEQIALTRANRIYLWAISLAALCGAMGIGASAFIINYSDKVMAAQNLQVRQLERDRDVARTEATKADARIAEANARAEEAIKQTAEAKLATETLRKETAPREFSAEQINKLAVLTGSGIKIEVDALYGDPEATIYAVQFVYQARQIGIESSAVTPKPDAMFFSVKIFGPDDQNTNLLVNIFTTPGTIVIKEISDTYRVYVGSRLPLFMQP